MTGKRFTIEPTITRECIVDNTTNEQLDTFDYTERLCEVLNTLNEEKEMYKGLFDSLNEKYTRKDNALRRTKKDIQKYTDYFMNELNWDCDRIIQEVFK